MIQKTRVQSNHSNVNIFKDAKFNIINSNLKRATKHAAEPISFKKPNKKFKKKRILKKTKLRALGESRNYKMSQEGSLYSQLIQFTQKGKSWDGIHKIGSNNNATSKVGTILRSPPGNISGLGRSAGNNFKVSLKNHFNDERFSIKKNRFTALTPTISINDLLRFNDTKLSMNSRPSPVLKTSPIKKLTATKDDSNNNSSYDSFPKMIKNEDSCELLSSGHICSHNLRILRVGHRKTNLTDIKRLLKSRNISIYKTKTKSKNHKLIESFNSKKRKVILDVVVDGNLLFDGSDSKHVVIHGAEAGLPADSRFGQSLVINPFQQFVEILPIGGKQIYFYIFLRILSY